MDSVTAIVLVRAGSRRLKNKNLQPFNGVTLLEHKILTLQQTPEVTKIVVSSDSDEMLNIARNRGVETHKRPAEYCDEISKPFGETVHLICSEVTGDHILWAPCTSPLVYHGLFSKAIHTYFDALQNGFDSLITVDVFKKFMWDEEKPLNYELGEKQVPSQLLPNLYVVTNGILLSPRLKAIEWKYTYGKNPYRMEIDKFATVDIDDALDLIQATGWLNEHKNKF